MQDHPVDDWFPVDEEEHQQQCAALLDLLGDRRARVLDLGAGDGRIAAPLVEAGHEVCAVDHDQRAVDHLRDRGIEAVRA
ncbi:MAG: methyltransferase, partial [Geminicoccaceae bacterium]|nr:methyltransferase [Geminicoccaceae bacterium]